MGIEPVTPGITVVLLTELQGQSVAGGGLILRARNYFVDDTKLKQCSKDSSIGLFFSLQVRELVFNLHMILSDTVKMKEYQEVLFTYLFEKVNDNSVPSELLHVFVEAVDLKVAASLSIRELKRATFLSHGRQLEVC